ncbi:hypothetical protein J7E63_02535 [Bacillus sp. ISL-75]|uniref:hypothetical protein n=1 Tax=Bacillus sp. ISL-75 TaxID=2819137 RepID=UPI001BE633DD|nr:hypothetical protein [Bacillus sp. ISL-75]MBT2725812.1 hypothetical protein [Bacillus sp. ISL-75]
MNKSAKVIIATKTKKFPVSPSLYGLFFEEINHVPKLQLILFIVILMVSWCMSIK